MKTPNLQLDDKTKQTINMITVAALELSKILNLPIACHYLTHPKKSGEDATGYPTDPLLILAIGKGGLHHAPGIGVNLSLNDLANKNTVLSKLINSSFCSKDEADYYFGSGGVIKRRIMSAAEAGRYSAAKTCRENLEMARESVANKWPHLNSLTKMPDGFQAIHPYIHKYTSMSCWSYAEAISELHPHLKSVALEFESDGLSGCGHACVKHEDGTYEDIWGRQSISEIEQMFNSKVKRELPLQEKLNSFGVGYSESDHFKREVSEARFVLAINPANNPPLNTRKSIIFK